MSTRTIDMRCENLSVRIGQHTLLNNVSINLKPGLLTGILGCNGAGKSTLVKALAGLIKPTQGCVYLGEQPLQSWPDRKRAATLAYISQGQSLQWPMSTFDVVALGRLPHAYGLFGTQLSALDKQHIDAAMRDTGIEHLATRAADVLSGGERARLMLARALAGAPAVLLADEPLAALDPAHQLRLMTLLRQQAAAGRTIALVLHDLSLAARFCDTLILLHEGRLLASGCVEEVLSDAHLHQAYGIEVWRGSHDGVPCIMPWQTPN